MLLPIVILAPESSKSVWIRDGAPSRTVLERIHAERAPHRTDFELLNHGFGEHARSLRHAKTNVGDAYEAFRERVLKSLSIYR